MDYKEILKNTGIEFIWLPDDFSKKGIYLACCPEFPNGAICVRGNLKSDLIEYVALHEIGHIVTGYPLAMVNERLEYLEHYRNEAKANRFLLHNIVPEFITANEGNPEWATADRLCNYLGIKSTVDNILIAEQEINFAFGN